MIESLLVYGVTVILLFFMLTVFSLLYQNWNVQTVANDTATRVAQTYKYKDTDVESNTFTLGDVEKVRPYRYIFNKTELEQSAKRRGKQWALKRLRETTFALEVDAPSVDIEEVRDGLARRHVSVTVTGKYRVPGSEILEYLGGTGDVVFEHTANAECLDIADYLGTVDFATDASGYLGKTAVGGFADSALKAIDSITKLFNTGEE